MSEPMRRRTVVIKTILALKLRLIAAGLPVRLTPAEHA
jgi:hypothetical protein